jgi:hypothetical protein
MAESLTFFLLLGFLVASCWVTFATVLADKLGSAIGGIVAGLPSANVVTFAFIGLNQSPQIASQATTDFPLVFSFSEVNLIFFVLFSRKIRFGPSLFSSLLIWLALVTLTIISNFHSFEISLIICFIVSGVICYFFVSKLRVSDFEGRRTKYTYSEIIFRAFFSGSVTLIAIFVSQNSGPLLGGIFSAFPAISIPTLYLTYRTKGIAFSHAVAKTFAVTAVLTVIPYCIGVRLFYPIFGVYVGTLFSYLVVIPFLILSYFLFNSKKLLFRDSRL